MFVYFTVAFMDQKGNFILIYILYIKIKLSLMTTIDFINKAIEVHGEKYNYYKTEYIKTSENIIITCPVHGNFNQKPSNHLSGSGCIECGYTSMKSKQKKREG